MSHQPLDDISVSRWRGAGLLMGRRPVYECIPHGLLASSACASVNSCSNCCACSRERTCCRNNGR